jgi:gamma-glutamyltranspeptidase / glutathione hydrolase
MSLLPRIAPSLAGVFGLLGALGLVGPTPAHAQFAPSAPEAASGFEAKPLARAKKSMVAAAHPLAVDAGNAILKAGGSATDAAIAVQLVLNLVEPQSSGIGGGAFLLHWDNRRAQVKSYDGRETAPAGVKPTMLLKADGTPRAFEEAVFGGESVGTPGLVRMLALAHKRHGVLPWVKLFEPAITLAEDGFPVSARLNKLLKEMGPLKFAQPARSYFFDEGVLPRAAGSLLKNPEFAATLKAIATSGADAFYTGDIAKAIVKASAESPNHKGTLAETDLAAYKALERKPVCTTYRAHRICGMGPPSSGALTVAQTLRLIAPFDLGNQPLNANAIHLIAEAMKLAYADRDQFIADPDQVAVPSGLLDDAYLTRRRALIDAEKAKPKADPGEPPGLNGRRVGIDATTESVGTSHISIIDRRGNAVALTTTIENGFGARLMAGGFLLNNELTDFSFRPVDKDGVAIANAIAPGKRPRSSMAPTLVFGPDGKLKAVLGSPGGSRIIPYVVKAIVGIIDWKLDAQAASELANFGSRNGPFEIEQSVAGVMPGLHMAKRGHQVTMPEMTSGLHIIVRRRDGSLEGGADPRREGVARGE